MKCVSASRARVLRTLATGILMLGAVRPALGQGLTIANPAKLPDLSVYVSAPASVDAYDLAYFTVTVTNLSPTTGFWASFPSNAVATHVDMTGLVPVFVQGDSRLSCRFGTGNKVTPWSAVDCTGDLPWGSSATIYVYFEPTTLTAFDSEPGACSNSYYCDQPTYVDALVRYVNREPERESTNNRAIARVDLANCIG